MDACTPTACCLGEDGCGGGGGGGGCKQWDHKVPAVGAARETTDGTFRTWRARGDGAWTPSQAVSRGTSIKH